jgi:hypothetical protein
MTFILSFRKKLKLEERIVKINFEIKKNLNYNIFDEYFYEIRTHNFNHIHDASQTTQSLYIEIEF